MADIFDFYVKDNRKIDFEIAEPIMREDNGVTDFVFHIPKSINGLDMSDWAWWFVFVNAKNEKYSVLLTLIDEPDRPMEYNIATYTVDYAMSIKAGSVQFALEAINAGTGGAIDNEWHTLTYETKVKDTLQGNQVEYAETESDIISALLVEVRNKVNQLVGGATPLPVSSISEMVDTTKVYILTTDKNWYLYNGSAWVSGGVYGAGVQIDSTLSQSGQAADAKKTGDAITNLKEDLSGDIDELKGGLTTKADTDDMLKAFPTDTASGPIASFPDGADDIPMKDVLVHIEPVQAGSGDPSPDNVRSIAGWTGATVQRTGRNLFSYENIKGKNIYRATVGQMGEDLNSFYLSGANGVHDIPKLVVTSWSYVDVFIGFRVEEETAITVSCKVKNHTENCNGFVRVRYNTTENRDGSTVVNTVFFNTVGTSDISISGIIPSGNYVFFEFSPAAKEETVTLTQYAEVSDFQFELGSTATSYEPYQGETYPIAFPTEAGTVYGGYVDMTGGELVVDRAQIASYNGETLPSTWISDRDVYASGTTPTIGAQVVYKLAEPIHYPLTAIDIKTLLGQNNIWADTGDTEVEYRADVTKYINKKITEAVSALT